ncbi:translation initiation factor [Lithospermum erythrorhizon]|uniref:Translation initiation factor n=1 Tax=Lithospermum erythrorhizon TaxID=34254 RepID=A0AAV3PR74_LITER
MQANQTLINLRPGGGGNKVSGPRSDNPTFVAVPYSFGSFKMEILMLCDGVVHLQCKFRWKSGDSLFDGHERIKYTKEQLLHLRKVVSIPEDILKAKQEVDAEFGQGHSPSWNRGQSHVKFDVQYQAPTSYSEPDTRDWLNRPVQPAVVADGRSWDTLREARVANQYGRQKYSKPQIGLNQGGGRSAALTKADKPWSVKRGSLSDKGRVLKTVKG